MVSSTTKYFCNLIRAAFLERSLENMEAEKRKEYGDWSDSRQDVSGAWLPHCVRYVRYGTMKFLSVMT